MVEEGRNWKKRWQGIKKRLRHTYRLVIMNDETFAEVGSYRLTLLNVYVFASTMLVLVAALVILAIVFTPLKKYIPGYAIASDGQMTIENLDRKVQSLEKQLEVQRQYSDNFRRILVGDVEKIEDVDKSVEEQADTLKEVNISEEELALRKDLAKEKIGDAALGPRNANFAPRDIPLEQMYFTPPINGTISAGFNPEEGHLGVDILAPKNTPIKAVMDGYIFFSDWTLETGNTIGIQHNNNAITFYKHNSVLLKKAGNYVKAGEAVAIIGNTGTLSDGPHLHFELWHKGKPADPKEYINF
jgi:murein DD-endopeptidase MepM/ murein hydrolase activator NlpD